MWTQRLSHCCQSVPWWVRAKQTRPLQKTHHRSNQEMSQKHGLRVLWPRVCTPTELQHWSRRNLQSLRLAHQQRIRKVLVHFDLGKRDDCRGDKDLRDPRHSSPDRRPVRVQLSAARDRREGLPSSLWEIRVRNNCLVATCRRTADWQIQRRSNCWRLAICVTYTADLICL